MNPPDGFARHFRQSPLTDPWEPLWSRREGDEFILALEVAVPHTNARGLAHGGLISALADNAMGLACVVAQEGLAGVVTASLSIDLLAAARQGDWLAFRARPLKLGRSLCFAACEVSAGDRRIARASAVFAVPAG